MCGNINLMLLKLTLEYIATVSFALDRLMTQHLRKVRSYWAAVKNFQANCAINKNELAASSAL